ncbi:hypothetical protein H5410_027551 [Solanum commersonii]|uniref:Uncharacterized protein n=1 Tax=Solanum commersonii TaxID=4109 RepID=A0A9J5YZH4_SOLCO|nr:hypothetical protein H5410_027551 [Solanum commersonii]
MQLLTIIPFISSAQAPKFSQNEVAPPSQSIVDLYDMHWSSKNITNFDNSHSSGGEPKAWQGQSLNHEALDSHRGLG